MTLLLGVGLISTQVLAQSVDQFDDLPLTAESCFEFEVFDPILQTCVIDCETEEQCQEYQAMYDEFLGNDFL